MTTGALAAGARASAAFDPRALFAAGVTALRRTAVQARLDLDDAEFAALVAAGVLVEVPLGPVARYVLAADLAPLDGAPATRAPVDLALVTTARPARIAG